MTGDGAFEAYDRYTYTAFPAERYRAFLDRYARAAGPLTGRVLDLGCGSGGLMEEVLRDPVAEVVGVDVSSAAVEACRRRPALADPRVHVLQSDAAALAGSDLARGGFDAVVSYSVLHFVPGDTASKLELLARLTRPGAVVAVDTLAKIPWNRGMFGLVALLQRTGLWGIALRLLRPIVGPSFPPAFMEELARMDYLRYLRYDDFFDVAALDAEAQGTRFEVLRREVVAQDGFFTGRKVRFALRRRS
jgi:SAM-dependent methyltransferase